MQSSEERRWYKDAVIYQTHVRAFADSNNDGIGDFAGLTSRLGYIQDLGITAIWILPFYPSPLRDDGYDIANYVDVNPIYGDLSDFKAFLTEAHARGLRVITELVLNHTSDRHDWFQRARRAPKGSKERNFYVWSDSPEKYKSTRIIFKDFEASNWTWDEVAGAYFWHRFYSHQPDLNFENPDVHAAMFEALDFWLDMGVDGVRLDAVPYLFEKEDTSCENLEETHGFLKLLRAHVDGKYSDRMLLAEANQWPEDAVEYFGDGDECHMAFHFPLMPRLFMAVQQEDRFPIIDILQQTPAIPDSCQWTIFLRNHDELTLEMVTDEERDFMYRVYARDRQARINLGIRRRLAPLLGNNRRKIELMNGLLFSLPGSPVLYYGDEIGMGDNIYLGDRDGVRTPMQWSADRNAGFSHTNPQKMYLPVITDPEFHYTAVNVETSQNSPHSLLWWMKRLIAVRKRFKAFSRGTLEFITPENSKVLVFVRRYEEQVILVVANLSRHVQYAEIDLSAFKGVRPIEIFGQTSFPTIDEHPYFITIGPNSFYWLHLKSPVVADATAVAQKLPTIRVNQSWCDIFADHQKADAESLLPDFLVKQRWFAGKARTIQATEIQDVIDLNRDGAIDELRLVIVRVLYTEGEPEHYLIPFGFALDASAEQLLSEENSLVIAKIEQWDESNNGVLYDASRSEVFWNGLSELISRSGKIKGNHGKLIASHTASYNQVQPITDAELVPRIMRMEQSNSAAVLGEKFILKMFRKVDSGVNPDLEISQFLTEKIEFPNSPRLSGAIEYRPMDGESMTFAILQEFIANTQPAWELTLDEIGRFFERVTSEFSMDELLAEFKAESNWIDMIDQEPTSLARNTIGQYLYLAELLGKRTAELHVALADTQNIPAFAPEPFTPFYQRGLYQSMRNHGRRVLSVLSRKVSELSPALQPQARMIAGLESEIIQRFRRITERNITALRIRCHGDYHLGQVLYSGKDFILIDFEGEPLRAISERKIKRSPLRDVAGMIRSFHYASLTGLLQEAPGVVVRTQDTESLKSWARFWYQWTSAAFVKAYLTQVNEAAFLPQSHEEFRCLLETYILEKALYEMDYEMNNRPDWIAIPLQGVMELMNVTST
ncbi:MAG: maltose alpha-D-glucosyltransferase [Pirellulaceae bacterium]|nr:maltose alpha-D-glucosyltransferase [Pirellulaceae bacterium]